MVGEPLIPTEQPVVPGVALAVMMLVQQEGQVILVAIPPLKVMQEETMRQTVAPPVEVVEVLGVPVEIILVLPEEQVEQRQHHQYPDLVFIMQVEERAKQDCRVLRVQMELGITI